MPKTRPNHRGIGFLGRFDDFPQPFVVGDVHGLFARDVINRRRRNTFPTELFLHLTSFEFADRTQKSPL